ncbi:hypothetical protein L218DRAFT_810970, partial [Marasmius fiardii PR-910]
IFLGYDWLERHNPSINWTKKTLKTDRCPWSCGYHELLNIEEDEKEKITDPEALLEEGEQIFIMDWEGYVEHGKELYIWAQTNVATELALKAAEGKQERTLEDIVPTTYHDYHSVFEKESFNSLPE